MRKLLIVLLTAVLLCVPARADGINPGVISGVERVPVCIAQRFSAEGLVVRVTDGRIEVKGTLIREPYNVIGLCVAGRDIYISTHWDYSDDYFEYVVLHEFGHYLDFSTMSGDWDPEEGERFADGFAAYILRPDELMADAPELYVEIERRLDVMQQSMRR